MKTQYWKLSVYNEKLKRFIVKAVCIPTEDDAVIFANTLIAKGMLVKISKQK